MKQQEDDEEQKNRRIKRLTQINRELIETLKAQNEDLSLKISRQKPKKRSSSIRSPSKQVESVRKELNNAYRQIDMYKEVILGLKAKEVPLDSQAKIKELEHKVKAQDTAIQNYQRELKYLAAVKEKQERELKIFSNDEAKEAEEALSKQILQLKEKLKTLKKTSTKRQDLEKKQHAYYMELEKALRKLSEDDSHTDRRESQNVDPTISEQEWTTVRTKIEELRKLHQQNGRKIDNAIRLRNRERKALEENELKLREKQRKLNSLRSRLTQLAKLMSREGQQTAIQSPKESHPLLPAKHTDDKNNERLAKQWVLPPQEQKMEVKGEQQGSEQ